MDLPEMRISGASLSLAPCFYALELPINPGNYELIYSLQQEIKERKKWKSQILNNIFSPTQHYPPSFHLNCTPPLFSLRFSQLPFRRDPTWSSWWYSTVRRLHLVSSVLSVSCCLELLVLPVHRHIRCHRDLSACVILIHLFLILAVLCKHSQGNVLVAALLPRFILAWVP